MLARATILLLVAAAAVRAQEPVIRISVTLVQVDAVVIDGRGRPVTDLRAEDFELLQDGRPQKITSFSYVPVAAPAVAIQPKPAILDAPPGPPPVLRPEQVRRTIAIVIDDLGLSFESIGFARDALKKFINERVQPGDLVAIVRSGSGMGSLQGFTTDRRLLQSAVERVQWNPMGRGEVSPFRPLGPAEGAGEEAETEEPEEADQIDELRREIFSVGTLGALDWVIRGLRDLPGRKSVVLVSDGLRIHDQQGYSDRVLSSMERLVDLANRASVVVYTLDARGLPTLGMTAADRAPGFRGDRLSEQLRGRRNEYFDSQDGLQYLAEQTGGLFFRDSNDLAGSLGRVLEDQQGYYLLGYSPSEATFNRAWHKIEVKVKRPGLRVRSRNGFYGVVDEQARSVPRTRNEQLLAALDSPFASGGVRLRLTSLFGNKARIGSYVHSLLHINGGDLTFVPDTEDWKKAVVDILVVNFGESGASIGESDRTYTIRMRGASLEKARANGFIYSIHHPIRKPGAYQLRTAVRDAASGRVGSATQFIEAPDVAKGRFAVSGIFLQTSAPQTETGEGPAYQTSPRGNPAVRTFHPGQQMLYVYQVLNPRLARDSRRPVVETQTRVFHNGRAVFASPPQPLDAPTQGDLTRLVAGGHLKLGNSMKPGEYVLQVLVTDRTSRKPRQITQWIDFQVAEGAP